MSSSRLGIGFIGSGFNARFHMQGFRHVRDADVLGVWSPNAKNAASAAKYARELDVGNCKAYKSITEMVCDPSIDAIWLNGPNHARIENVEEVCAAVTSGKATLKGIACEKPLGRTVAEAKHILKLVEKAGIMHGYLENQYFSPQVSVGHNLIWKRGAANTGRPYLARAAEEHSGPHMPWFWNGEQQGGGVLNDMMCHSVLVVRQLLTPPGESLTTLVPKRVTGHIASLKWSRKEYAAQLKKSMGVDYLKKPSEDFASVTIEFETPNGGMAIGEATTSWSFVGPGLRLSAELLGPEYSMKWNSLESGLDLFFSRAVKGKAGEDIVEKQMAETGQMPVVVNEAIAYGYEAENRHFVRAFLGKEKPALTWHDGLDVVKLLMTAYMSAEQGKTIEFPPRNIDKFVPQVAQGTWKPR
ncbi:MAG: Gfo/Idh/MocA family oxidoreductase [Gemmatimonadota bacterium]|nr:Gfo/Idh/MocA family oxidoreductase [Gemmatimonadota bacterium]